MPLNSDGGGRVRSRPRRFLNWKVLLGVGLSAGLLYYALRDVHFADVFREIRTADPLLFLAAVTAATVIYVVRAWRWKPILEPVKPGTRFRPRFACVSIGFMGNNLLPARMGEFARAYSMSRLEGIPVTSSLASLVVERLFDGMALVAFLLVAMAHPDFPDMGLVAGVSMGRWIAGVGAVLAVVAGLLLSLALWPAQAARGVERLVARLLPARLGRAVIEVLEAFLSGVVAIRHPGLVVRAALWSVVLWLLGALSFWLGFLAFDIHVPFTAAIFLQSLVSLFVSMPSAPGFFGLFEAAARVGLVDVFGVDAASAVGFAIGFHMGGFIPITVIGLYYVWRLGISWRDVEQSEEIVEEAVESAAGVEPLVEDVLPPLDTGAYDEIDGDARDEREGAN
ncbi:MAG TPA: lysylphosphatidylglycerol synthase transmembrane domain-containing protein [Longimicrobiales bacterium]|nr:lysylphosphatidylglycerol synthase transmembrane domain-containing protein [Longimicrobiales bacterium]